MNVQAIGDLLAGLNACLNATSFVLLVSGVRAIKRKEVARHKSLMQLAFLSSTLFLASYVTRHLLTGSHRIAAEGGVKVAYLVLLVSHVLLAAVTVPFALRSLFLGRKGRFDDHKKVAKVTFPIWAYVSVTGVMVYLVLYHIVGKV